MLDNVLLIGYFLTWFVTLLWYIRDKASFFDATSVLFFFQLIYSFFSILLFNDQAYGHLFKPMKLFPLVYLYFFLMLTSWPIIQYTSKGINKLQMPTTLFVYSLSLLYISVSVISLPQLASNFISGTINIIIDSSAGLEMYNDSISESRAIGDGTITNIPAIIRSAFSSFGFLLLFYCLAIPKKNKLIIIGLAISCFLNIIGWISLGQRGGVVKMILVFIITYAAFKNFLSCKINKIIKHASIFLILAISIPLIGLTISRFKTNNGGPLSSLYYYAGQANLYFNNYGLDDNGIRYGDRTIPILKKIIGFENVPNNFVERRIKYHDLYINDEVFSTYIGDFTIDFGPLCGALILIINTLIVLHLTKSRNNDILFHQLIILHLTMSICIQGGMSLYQFADIGGAIQLALYIITYFVFRLDYELNFKHNGKISFIYSNYPTKK